MSLDKVNTELKTAMKARDEVKVATLRMLIAAVKNRTIEKKTEALSNAEFTEVVQKQVKMRKDSVAEYEKAGRKELVEKEQKEIDVLKAYLPEQLSEDKIKEIVQTAIQESGAKTKAEVGKVMKAAMPKLKGKADGKTVNQIAASLLS